MTDLSTMIQQGSTNIWLFIPSAILLGALHGLEPGHSKTMMAAFIIAVRGTFTQAVLLGLAATLSHTAVVWGVALIGMYYGAHYNADTSEPYFQVASGFLIIAVAIWMLMRTYGEHQKEIAHALEHHHEHDLNLEAEEYQDAHELAHAADIKRRFEGRQVTTGQIILFGLTGGLIPCPAAITVLLLCLQLKKFTLGVGLVLCFSIGLAVTMVSAGALAALGVHHASKRVSGFETLARRAPYFSSALIICIGLYVFYEGFIKLPSF